VKASPVAIVAILVSVSAFASKAGPFAGLLGRAETVALVTLSGHDATSATFTLDKLYRGAFAAKQMLRLGPTTTPPTIPETLPAGVTHFVAISQGDDRRPPTDILEVGQGIKGQAGFQGWIIYPVRHIHGQDVIDPKYLIDDDGTLAIARLDKLVDDTPYHPKGK
jgi:hypothetical protein